MQSIFIAGNLAADCEIIQGKEGAEFLKFNVAVNNGQDEKPTYYSCRMRKTGVAEHLKKGRFVAVAGDLKVSTNEKEGKTYVNLDVWANRLDVSPIAKEG